MFARLLTFRIWWLQVLYMAINSGFLAILYVYFIRQDISLAAILLAEALGTIFVVVYLVFRGRLSSPGSIRLGFLFLLVSALCLLIPIPTLQMLYPYVVCKSLGGIIFFTTYNILYFGKKAKTGNMQQMSWYWGVGVVTSVVAPFIGGVLFDAVSLPVYIMVFLGMVALAFPFTAKLPKQTCTYTVQSGLTAIRKLRLLNIVDGALHKAKYIATGVFALQFFQTGASFGSYLSFVGVIGAAVGYQLSGYSDKKQNRMILIVPLSILAACSMVGFLFASSGVVFAYVAALLTAVVVILDPARSNVVLDVLPRSPMTWISREIYLNIGRIGVFFVAAAFVALGRIDIALFAFAVLYVVFPLLLRYKQIYV